MRVTIKNKMFSLRGSSRVKNEQGEDVFFVKGKFFSPTHVKRICDINKNELYRVRNKWINFFNKRAYIYQGDTKIATVKHPFFSGNKFVLEGYKDDISIAGGFFSLHSTIIKNGVPIGAIDREFFALTDTFTLEADEKNMPLMIALVIAIDNIVDKMTDSHD